MDVGVGERVARGLGRVVLEVIGVEVVDVLLVESEVELRRVIGCGSDAEGVGVRDVTSTSDAVGDRVGWSDIMGVIAGLRVLGVVRI